MAAGIETRHTPQLQAAPGRALQLRPLLPGDRVGQPHPQEDPADLPDTRGA